jgi:hypothetical protein
MGVIILAAIGIVAYSTGALRALMAMIAVAALLAF